MITASLKEASHTAAKQRSLLDQHGFRPEDCARLLLWLSVPPLPAQVGCVQRAGAGLPEQMQAPTP